MPDRVESYWQAFWATLPPDSSLHARPRVAEPFGDSPELANELGSLIVVGKKTATCSALWEYEATDEPLPAPGLLTLVLDGDNQPLCIIETTEIEIRAFNQVDARFAWEEGEGDRSLAYWRRAHTDFFTRSLAQIGKQPTEDMPLVCERFRLLHQR